MKGSNLTGFSFGLSPSNVRYSFTDKLDHKRILVLDFVRVEEARLCFLNKSSIMQYLQA